MSGHYRFGDDREHDMKSARFAHLFIAVWGVLFLAACAQTQFLIHTAKVVKGKTGDTQSSQGRYKVGDPYEINGTWYYPAVDYDYDETGIASWYGPNFHGKTTANGEVYDMNALTAAHRTLPMPSWVEVTNLENGRKLKLRINDRGPFAKGRIIDISRQGAQLLGFQTNGTAKVRVKILADESRAVAAHMKAGASIAEIGSPITVESVPTEEVSTEPLTPPVGADIADSPPEIAASVETVVIEPVEPVEPSQLAAPAPALSQQEATVELVPVTDTGIFVQAGAYSRYDNANRVQAILSPLGNVEISRVLVNNLDLYRVRVGPITDVQEADQILDRVIGVGYPDAKVIVD